MLNIESLVCAGKALLYGVPVGIIFITLINFAVIQIMPIGVSIPWNAIIVVFLSVFLLIWLTIHISSIKWKKQNIIEVIRM